MLDQESSKQQAIITPKNGQDAKQSIPKAVDEQKLQLPRLDASTLGSLGDLTADVSRMSFSMRAGGNPEAEHAVRDEFSASTYSANASTYGTYSRFGNLRNLSLSSSVKTKRVQRVIAKLKEVEDFFLSSTQQKDCYVEIDTVKLSDKLYTNFPELKPKKVGHLESSFIISNFVVAILKREGYFMANFYDLIKLGVLNAEKLLSGKVTKGLIPEYIEQILVDVDNEIDPNAVLLFSSKFLHEVLKIHKDKNLEDSVKRSNDRRLEELRKLTQGKVNSNSSDANLSFAAKVLINLIKTYIANNKLENSVFSQNSSSSESQLLTLLHSNQHVDFSILEIFRKSNAILMIDDKLVQKTFSFIDTSGVMPPEENEKIKVKFLTINTYKGSYKEDNFECVISEDRLKYLKNPGVFEFFKMLGLNGKQILTAPLRTLELLNSPLQMLLIDESIEKHKLEGSLKEFFESSGAALDRMSEVTVVAKFLEDLFEANGINHIELSEAMAEFDMLDESIENVKRIFNDVISRYPEIEYHIEVKYGYVAGQGACLQSSGEFLKYLEDKKSETGQPHCDSRQDGKSQSYDASFLSEKTEELIKKHLEHFKYLMSSGVVSMELITKLDYIEFSALLCILGREWVKSVTKAGDFSYFFRLKQSDKTIFLEKMLDYLAKYAEDVAICQFLTKPVPENFIDKSNKRKVLEGLICGDMVKLEMLVKRNRFGIYCLMKAVHKERSEHFLDLLSSSIIQNYLESLPENSDFKYKIFKHNTEYLTFLREVLVHANDNAKDMNARHNYTRLNMFISECVHRWNVLYQPFDRNSVVQKLIMHFDTLFLPACAILYNDQDCATTAMIEARDKLKGSEQEQNELGKMHISTFIANLATKSMEQAMQEDVCLS